MAEDEAAARRPDGRPHPWLATAVITVVAVTAGVLLISRASRSDPAASAPQTSVDVAHFNLPALVGTGRVRLDDFRGKPLVVNFFASWCTACRGEAPGFRSVRAAVHGTVLFEGVDSMESGNGVVFARELGISDWLLARDVGGSSDSGLLEAIGGIGLPITAFYSAEGKLLATHVGALDEPTLRAELRSLYGVRV
jgi:thiol-disulfide isomerase/thioredoxin